MPTWLASCPFIFAAFKVQCKPELEGWMWNQHIHAGVADQPLWRHQQKRPRSYSHSTLLEWLGFFRQSLQLVTTCSSFPEDSAQYKLIHRAAMSTLANCRVLEWHVRQCYTHMCVDSNRLPLPVTRTM